MNLKSPQRIVRYFSQLSPDPAWSFSDPEDRKKSTYITHSYHRYPAKFTPQIAERLVTKYGKENTVVCDPFGGCGTTLVESKILGFESIGFDINPVAKLITETKLKAIRPEKLSVYAEQLFDRILDTKIPKFTLHEKLDFWFPKIIQRDLYRIYLPITRIRDEQVRNFFLCGFSHILKNCSVWLMKSIKPTRDPNKEISEPFDIFKRHINSMLRKNDEFYNLLRSSGKLDTRAKMKVADARNLPLKDNSVDLIITSPPYVTSYEYADLHQLSLLWFDYTDDLADFRKRFIGTASQVTDSSISDSISSRAVEQLKTSDRAVAKDVGNYFADMKIAFDEMYRILRKGGHVCLILGNTTLKGVEIPNAESAYEQMLNIGFKHEKVIKREIRNQMIAPWRDKENGRFTSLKNRNKRMVYQYEYVIVMKK